MACPCRSYGGGAKHQPGDHHNGKKVNYVTDELYDSINDPEENYNIAGLKPNLTDELSKQLNKGWRAKSR